MKALVSSARDGTDDGQALLSTFNRRAVAAALEAVVRLLDAKLLSLELCATLEGSIGL